MTIDSGIFLKGQLAALLQLTWPIRRTLLSRALLNFPATAVHLHFKGSMARPEKSIFVNGQSFILPDDARVSLLDFLREHLQLHGTKKGCNQGACGACTVLLGGERILSCMALAAQFEGCKVTTVEGLSVSQELSSLQEAFVEQDGFQCGYCTPGQICSAIGMANELQRGVPSNVTEDIASHLISYSDDELRERMSGNLCRCGAHNGIIAAIKDGLRLGSAPSSQQSSLTEEST